MLSSKGAEILEMIENSRTDEILDMDTFGFLENDEQETDFQTCCFYCK